MIMNSRVVIVADGTFPTHDIPLGYIRDAERIICCDGSVKSLINAGYIPEAIVGDMDSISDELADKFRDRLFSDSNPDTNDLTKTVNWCKGRGYKDMAIVGATGKREDHTIGNISLLADYIKDMNVMMVTDTGIFYPFLKSCRISTFPGQQVSIFSIDHNTKVSSRGLKYALSETQIKNWWVATLNEATGNHFELGFTGGPVIVFLKFRD